MSRHTLLIRHRAKPGQRAAVQAVWRRHMQPAIAANAGHELYAYAFEADPDRLCALQIYKDREAAQAFLQHPAYQAYEADVASLLDGPPEVQILDVQWVKGD